jgi:hypothetical protein
LGPVLAWVSHVTLWDTFHQPKNNLFAKSVAFDHPLISFTISLLRFQFNQLATGPFEKHTRGRSLPPSTPPQRCVVCLKATNPFRAAAVSSRGSTDARDSHQPSRLSRHACVAGQRTQKHVNTAQSAKAMGHGQDARQEHCLDLPCAALLFDRDGKLLASNAKADDLHLGAFQRACRADSSTCWAQGQQVDHWWSALASWS